MEKNEVLGATAIEDKLQDEVPATIEKIRRSAGREGRRSVNSSDFAIGQFSYLQRLL